MKTVVIINPGSGKGKTKGLDSALRSALSDIHPETHRTSYPGQGAEIARRAVEDKVDTIIAVGGDGTVNEIINVIANKNIKLGIIPYGTANDLATLNNLPSKIDEACRIIVNGNFREIDLISVNGSYYATSGGMGLPCDVTGLANSMKNRSAVGKTLANVLGSRIYIFAVIAALFNKVKKDNILRLRYGNRSVKLNALSVMVDNQPFLGKNIFMSPGALNDDGLFDTCLINNGIGRLRILYLLSRILKGTHISLPYVEAIKTNRLTIISERPISFFGDGEILHRDSTFDIKLIHKALKLIVPLKKRERQ